MCEYIGVLRRTHELENVDDNDYIFEIDCLHTIKGVEGREVWPTNNTKPFCLCMYVCEVCWLKYKMLVSFAVFILGLH